MAKVLISSVTVDRKLQSRVKEIDADTVAEYAEWLTENKGQDLPPILCLKDKEGTLWLYDGFQRCAAYASAGRKDIPADIKPGAQREALLLSLGANATHGLKRTQKDKRKAVRIALEDEEWGKWADTKVADYCNVGRELVGEIRGILLETAGCKGNEPRKVTTEKNGEIYTTTVPPKKADPPQDAGDAWEQPAADPKVGPMDLAGNPIPKSLRDTFAGNVDAIESAVKILQEVRRTVKGLSKWNPYMRPGEMETKLDELIEDFKNGKPYAVHQDCKGKGCKECRTEGWLPKWRSEEMEAAK